MRDALLLVLGKILSIIVTTYVLLCIIYFVIESLLSKILPKQIRKLYDEKGEKKR